MDAWRAASRRRGAPGRVRPPPRAAAPPSPVGTTGAPTRRHSSASPTRTSSSTRTTTSPSPAMGSSARTGPGTWSSLPPPAKGLGHGSCSMETMQLHEVLPRATRSLLQAIVHLRHRPSASTTASALTSHFKILPTRSAQGAREQADAGCMITGCHGKCSKPAAVPFHHFTTTASLILFLIYSMGATCSTRGRPPSSGDGSSSPSSPGSSASPWPRSAPPSRPLARCISGLLIWLGQSRVRWHLGAALGWRPSA